MILEGSGIAQVAKTLLALVVIVGFITLAWKATKKEWWWERFKK